MLLCQRKRGATWTSEKDENVQRLLERSTKLSDGCAFRECERMSDGEFSRENSIRTLLCYDKIWRVRVRRGLLISTSNAMGCLDVMVWGLMQMDAR